MKKTILIVGGLAVLGGLGYLGYRLYKSNTTTSGALPGNNVQVPSMGGHSDPISTATNWASGIGSIVGQFTGFFNPPGAVQPVNDDPFAEDFD